MNAPKYPEIGTKWVCKLSGDLVIVVSQDRIYHRTGRFAWTALVGYKFLTGIMENKTGSASLPEFRDFFKEVKL